MYFTQEQLDTIQLPIRGKRIKLEVLNDDKQTLATLEGNAIGGGLQKDATSFVRRSGSIQLAIPRLADATTFLDLVNGVTINVNGKIWLDKQIRISVGIDNYIQPYGQEPKTVWYDFGICLIDQPVRSFSADAYTMAFNVIDLAAKMNGDRGGQLTALTTMIKRVQQPDEFGELIPNPLEGSVETIVTMAEDVYDIYIGSAYGGFSNRNTSGSLIKYNKETQEFTRIRTFSAPVHTVLVDNSNVYIGIAETSVFSPTETYDVLGVYNKSTEVIAFLQTPYYGASNGYTVRMVQDANNIYCGGTDASFYVFNKTNNSFGSLIATPFWSTIPSPTIYQTGLEIYSMAIDNDNVYCASYAGDFAVYSKSSGTFGSVIRVPIQTTRASGPSYYTILSMVEDDSKVYVGGGNALFAIYDKSLGAFGTPIQSTFSSAIYALEQDNNNVYLGGAKGKFAIYNKRTSAISGLVPNPFGGSNIYSLLLDDSADMLYVGGDSGKLAIYGEFVYTYTKDALASTIEELGFIKEYTIYPIPEKWAILPYDIKVTVGQTVYDILKQFLDILNGWQMYFDNMGKFVVEPIPSGANDIVYPLNAKLNIVDTNSVDFNYVKNQVVVYGRSHELNHFTEECSYDQSNNLTLAFEELDLTKIQISTTLFGFKNSTYLNSGVFVGAGITSVTIQSVDNSTTPATTTTVVSNAPISIYGIESPTPFDEMPLEGDEIYVFRIREATLKMDDNNNYVVDFSQPVSFELLGKQQISYSMVNGNTESPFYINKGYHTDRCAYGDNTIYTLTRVGNEDRDLYTIKLTTDLGVVQRGDIITFVSPSSNVTQTVYVNITNYDGSIYANNKALVEFGATALTVNKLGNDYTIWEMQYDGTSFVLNGHCPYSLPLVESGGEFDNIYADELAKERATYDLFLHSNLQNTITLSCVPDYSLDVNYRIPYNSSSAVPPDSKLQDDFEDRYFITKQVTYPLGLDNTSQQVTAIEIYDDFNYVGYSYDLPTTT